jgi:hypothetical protein
MFSFIMLPDKYSAAASIAACYQSYHALAVGDATDGSLLSIRVEQSPASSRVSLPVSGVVLKGLASNENV